MVLHSGQGKTGKQSLTGWELEWYHEKAVFLFKHCHLKTENSWTKQYFQCRQPKSSNPAAAIFKPGNDTEWSDYDDLWIMKKKSRTRLNARFEGIPSPFSGEVRVEAKGEGGRMRGMLKEKSKEEGKKNTD